jgi:rSAM/selenodomain-associated transferase 2
MISVIIPTFNAESELAAAMTALVPATVEGVVREVIVVDAGSNDRTAAIVEQSGARFVVKTGGRGYQMLAGAHRARFPWLLFLHPGTVLEPGWEREAVAFMEAVDGGKRPRAAASFRFALDDVGGRPRTLEQLAKLRSNLLKLPYGDQGLLIDRALYREIGGHNPQPLLEDLQIARRLRRGRIVVLRARAITSAQRYQREGYLVRSIRNLAGLLLYFVGARSDTIAGLYR